MTIWPMTRYSWLLSIKKRKLTIFCSLCLNLKKKLIYRTNKSWISIAIVQSQYRLFRKYFIMFKIPSVVYLTVLMMNYRKYKQHNFCTEPSFVVFMDECGVTGEEIIVVNIVNKVTMFLRDIAMRLVSYIHFKMWRGFNSDKFRLSVVTHKSWEICLNCSYRD